MGNIMDMQKKEVILKSFVAILQSIGTYQNDCKVNLTYDKESECVVYTSSYGIVKQSVKGDSATAFFEDVLKLLLNSCKELEDTKRVIEER